MGVLQYLLLSLANFFVMAIDIVMFFLIVRLVLLSKPVNWLIPFDHAGHSLVEYTTGIVHRYWMPRSRKPLNERKLLIISFVVFVFIRFLFSMLWLIV